MIADWLSAHFEDINQGKIKVLVQDECHLKAGDICGYGWGARQERLDVKVNNYPETKIVLIWDGASHHRSGGVS